MSDVFAGIVGAWSVSHAAIGLYFLLAFALGRREREFMLFGLLCFAFSIASIGISLDFLSSSPRDRQHFDVLAHVGFIIAGALNLHFALEFARFPGRARLLPVIYVGALVFEVANVMGWLWVDHRAVVTTVFGRSVHYGVGTPTAFGYLFYAFGSVETLGSIALLANAYRSGRPEALSALIGAALVLPALVNDLGIALGVLGSLGAVRLIRGMLFETSPLDPLVFTIVVALLALGGLAACLIPARRATSISPMAALREE